MAILLLVFYSTLTKNVFFVGRLAEYTYINTDEAILRGFKVGQDILKLRPHAN